jgi:hypothetical protein
VIVGERRCPFSDADKAFFYGNPSWKGLKKLLTGVGKIVYFLDSEEFNPIILACIETGSKFSCGMEVSGPKVSPMSLGDDREEESLPKRPLAMREGKEVHNTRHMEPSNSPGALCKKGSTSIS